MTEGSVLLNYEVRGSETSLAVRCQHVSRLTLLAGDRSRVRVVSNARFDVITPLIQQSSAEHARRANIVRDVIVLAVERLTVS